MNALAPAFEQASANRAGEEPLPGYRLIEPLGRGGFGEVWKCEAPGGLLKAIKFVPSDEANHSLRQEFEAFQQIKAIRHPFLLQLERVELTPRELIMVMELADSQLQERFLECRSAGQPGIPREELLAYLADAAEALDVISVRHGLQHLDVKPANLFIVCGRVKVGDYGLVRAETSAGAVHNRGFTPRYVAPEVLCGRVDPRSDQYSLALVYQELLTGTFPYTARTAQQMMMAHSTALPDLSALPPEDQAAIGIALSKNPEERFPSCLAFIQALMLGGQVSRHDTVKPNDTAQISSVRLSRVATASGFLSRPNLPALPAAGSHQGLSGTVQLPSRDLPPQFGAATAFAPPPPQFGEPPPTVRQSGIGPSPFGGSSASIAPRSLRESGTIQSPFSRSASITATITQRSIIPEEPVDLVAAQRAALRVRISDKMLKSVLPVTVLTGKTVIPAAMSGDGFINALMTAALGETDPLGRNPDGTWAFRFRSTHPASVARHKLEAMKSDEWFDDIQDRDESHILLRRYAKTGLLGRIGGRKAGLELTIAWPTGRGGEVELNARLFGEPDAKFSRGIAEVMPRLFNELRMLLQAGDERRKDPRIPVGYALTLYPLQDNGEVHPPLAARARNISSGGLCLVSNVPLPTRYAYIEFPEIASLPGVALLTKLIRSQPNGPEHLFAGKFRRDL